ncbi:MAG: c-type cytochrome [Usitatibacter sp.]
MGKAVKYLLMGVAVLAFAGAAFFGGAVWMGERKMQRAVDVRVVPVPFTRDAAALPQGKYLFESRGCGECHGMDGRGRVLIDNPNGLYVRTPSIAPGPGSAVAGYVESDWVRAIRHGIDPKGRALLIMPSEDYNRMNDGDFAALVAYARSLPAGPGAPATVRFPAFMKALYAAGAIQDAAAKIDHRLPPAAAVPVAANVEHGAYVANMCIGCHGAGLAGGKIPGMPPEWPPASNLTPGEGSAMARYDTWEKLAAMMRSGRRPDGSEVSNVMPFASLAKMNDTDVRAVHAFLRTLPARKAGER